MITQAERPIAQSQKSARACLNIFNVLRANGMFSKVLVGIDGSSYAEKAVSYAVDIAKKYESNVTLVHVIDFHVYAYEQVVVAQSDTRLKEEGKQILNRGQELARSLGMHVNTKLVAGSPADEISRLANTEGFDLVVIGNRGLGSVKAFLLGSVSERVSRLTKCPVLIVKT